MATAEAAEPEPEPSPAPPPLRPTRLKGHTAPIAALALDPHRPPCLASGGEDGTLRLWDTRVEPGAAAHSRAVRPNPLPTVSPLTQRLITFWRGGSCAASARTLR